MTTDQGGFFERTQGSMHPVVVEDYSRRRMGNLGASSVYLLRVMSAHAVMLARRAIIPQPAAAALARTLALWVEQGGIPPARLDPALEDLYINMEHLLAQELGPEVSGHLPVARSRNDVEASMWRMELREKLAALADELLRHVAILGERADLAADALMPVYTYDQQAQPATLGFTLSAYSAALLRDVERRPPPTSCARSECRHRERHGSRKPSETVGNLRKEAREQGPFERFVELHSDSGESHAVPREEQRDHHEARTRRDEYVSKHRRRGELARHGPWPQRRRRGGRGSQPR